MKNLLIALSFCIFCFVTYGQVEMGGETNYTEIEQDGTMEFHGDATVWNDLVVPFYGIKTNSTKPPAWESFIGGISQYKFENETEANEQEVGFVVQILHGWDGSAIYPHIHWSPENDNAGNVVWGMEYTWVDFGNEFPTPITIKATSEDCSGKGHNHLITKFDPITPNTNQDGLSSLLLVRFFRNSSNAADDYGSGAFGLSWDLHYKINTAGSRQELVK